MPCNLGSPCGIHGTCTNDNLGGYTCACATGYTGTNCNIRKRLTLMINHSKHNKNVLKFIFSYGLKEHPCILLSNLCAHGTCINDNSGGYTCSCDDGYTGTTCNICKKSLILEIKK